MRTVWDVLTQGVGRDINVTHPYRPSHALIELPNDWQVSVTVAPTSGSSLGQGFAVGLVQPISELDVMGRGGSPEGWFDRAQDAEVAIQRPDGTWYRCEVDEPGGDPDKPAPWRFVSVADLAQLLVRLVEQPAGCLCPACAVGEGA